MGKKGFSWRIGWHSKGTFREHQGRPWILLVLGGPPGVASLAGQSWKRKRTRGKGKVGHARDLEED